MSLTRVIVRRILISIPLIFIVSTLTFVMESLIPGNAAQVILGTQATPSAVAQLERQLHLNQPLYVQYWRWLDGIVHGDFGRSLVNNQSVLTQLNERLPVTIAILVGSLVVGLIVGVAMGVLSALRPGRLSRGAIDSLSVFGIAMPTFWLALLLVEWLAVVWHLFPSEGYTSPGASVGSWMHDLLLPWLALGIGQTTYIAKQTRDGMSAAVTSAYAVGLQAAGIGRSSLVLKHALRNAAIPVVTVAGLLFVGALTGSVVVEQIFVLPGLGSLALSATATHDIPVIQGVAVYFTIIVVFVNLVIDIAYTLLDPRTRTRLRA